MSASLTMCVLPSDFLLGKQNSSPFSSALLQLAIVALPSGANLKGNFERVLLALGVRRHVEVRIDRLQYSQATPS